MASGALPPISSQMPPPPNWTPAGSSGTPVQSQQHDEAIAAAKWEVSWRHFSI